MRTSLRWAWIVGAFLLLATGLVVFLARDWGPAPLYLRYRHDRSRPPCFVTPTTPVSIAFRVPPRNPHGFAFPLLAAPGSELDVRVLALPGRAVVADATFDHEGIGRVVFDELPVETRRLLIEFTSTVEDPARAPAVAWLPLSPLYEGEVRYGGAVQPRRGPLLLLEYGFPTRWALLLWLAAGPAALLALVRPRYVVPALLLVGLACTATGGLLWRQHYSLSVAHGDADQYGKNARELAAWLTEPERREEIEAWWHGFPHTHHPLAPAIMALPVLLGAPIRETYGVFSALSGFAAVLLVLRILRRHLGCSHAVAFGATVFFACHVTVLRSFARPVTDAFGLALWLAVVELVLDRVERTTRARSVLLALSVLALPLARPQGPSLLVFALCGFLAAERWRTGGWALPALARRLALVFGLPGLVLTAMHVQFDWFHNVRLMFAKAERYRIASTPQRFFESLGITLQLLPLLWLASLKRVRERKLLLLTLLLAAYLAVLVVVRAPFMIRHFLLALPPAIALAACGLDRLRGTTRAVGLGLLLLLGALNVALVAYQVLHVPEVVLPRLLD